MFDSQILKSSLFYSLITDGKKEFLKKFPHEQRKTLFSLHDICEQMQFWVRKLKCFLSTSYSAVLICRREDHFAIFGIFVL